MTKPVFVFAREEQDNRYLVWGIGDDPEAALADGIKWIAEYYTDRQSRQAAQAAEINRCKVLKARRSIIRYVDTYSGESVPGKYIEEA